LAQFRVGGVSVCGNVSSANFSTVERVAHWVAGLRMFQAHPLLGVGAGNYDAVYARYACTDWPDSLGHAHNYYINAAAETGILGLLAFLALVAVTLALGWRAMHPHASALTAEVALADDTWAVAPTRALALGLFAVVAALTIHNLTDDLFVHGMELQLALCLACLLRLLGPPNAPN
jgi:O-antigen ligase